MPQARDQADPRPRGVLRGRLPHRGRPLRAQPPHAARRERRGLRQPRQAELGRLPGGLPARQGQRRPRPALEACGRDHRPDRLPAGALLPPARRRLAARGARPRRRPDAGVRRRQRLLRGAEERHSRAGARQRRHRRDRPRARPPARRDRRRPLPAPRGLRQPPGAPVRADEVDARPAEAVVRHERVLPEELGRDGARLRASGPSRSPPRSRSPSAARSTSSSARC